MKLDRDCNEAIAKVKIVISSVRLERRNLVNKEGAIGESLKPQIKILTTTTTTET